MIKSLFALLISILSFSSIYSQRAFLEIPDSSDYYSYTWKKNLDSLSNQWHYNNIFLGSDFNLNIDKIAKQELNINPRSVEILNLYLENYEKSLNAFSINNHYSDTLEAIFVEQNLNPNFKYLPFVMSALNPNARSISGGFSYFQMQYAAARVYNLTVDSYVDERKLIIKSAISAANYLNRLKTIYNDENLALLAYSCGPRNLNKAIRRKNNSRNNDSLYNSLPEYGRDIVYALEATEALENIIEKNEIKLNSYNWELDFDTIHISNRVHFIQLSDILHISIDSIRFLNPQYKYDIVPADDDLFTILLPKGYLVKFNELEDSIYTYKDSTLFDIHKKIILPAPAKGRAYARYEPEPIPAGSKLVHYHIKSGDNLGFIASWFDVSVREVKEWNNIYNERRLQINQKLKIYVPEEKYSYYKQIDDMSFAQKQNKSGSSSTVSPVKKEKEYEPLGDDFFYYTVKSGESPYLIAKKFPGVSAEDIVKWNKIDPRDIRPGDKLKIKKIE